MEFGLDVGYSGTKGVAMGRSCMFHSAVGTPDKAHFRLSGDTDNITLIKPRHVQIGQGAIKQSRFLQRREDRQWIKSPEWYSLAMAAITELTQATRVDLYIVTGLPVAFYDDKNIVKDRLAGEHVVQREGQHTQKLYVEEVKVIPQPFGALLAETLDDNGNIVNHTLASGTAGILDIGSKTTNLLSVDCLSEVGRETESINVGAWDAVRALRRWLSKNCPDLDLRDHEISDAIINRQVRYYGEIIDLTEPIENTLRPMSAQITAAVSQVWNGGAGLTAILISGGGALLLGPYIQEHLRHARIVNNPILANATGYWKFARFVA